MYRSILVPLDSSALAEQALPLARGIARRAGAALRVLHVVPPLPLLSAEAPLFLDDDLTFQREARARAYLDAVVKRLGGTPPIPTTPVVMKGEVADCIREQAAESGADLVVMTTHGRGPLARFWLGSVADELVRRLPVPLLLVRPRETAPDPGQEPDLGRVLLPLDGSAPAEQIIEPAVALGSLAGAEYTLLRVVRPAVWVHAVLESPDARREAQSLLDRVEGLQRQVLKEAEDYLAGVAQRLRARGLRVQTRVAVDEHPAGAILHEAAAGGAGLIALATHGRRGLSRLLLGSVADKVVRGAPVPVLVRRPAAAPPGEKAAG